MVTEEIERNITHAREVTEEAARKGAVLVVLPASDRKSSLLLVCEFWRAYSNFPNCSRLPEEIWNSPYSNDTFPIHAEDIEARGDAAPSCSMLSEAASTLTITIIGGSIPERSVEHLYNSCIFGKDGTLKGKHRKLHLFDIDIPGKITFNESKTLTHGQHPIIVDTDVGRIGMGICHDISFPELAMLYGAKGAHLICCPGPWYIWHDNWSFALGVISKSKIQPAP